MKYLNIFKIHFPLSFFILFSLKALGQEIIVKDAETNLPLEGVAIFNIEKTKSSITDSIGKASLKNFSPPTTVFLQLMGYDQQELLLQDLEKKMITKKGRFSLN